MTRPGMPVSIAERSVALDARTALRLAAEDVGGASSVALYVEGDGARVTEPLVRVPPRAIREIARALDRLAGALGVQP